MIKSNDKQITSIIARATYHDIIVYALERTTFTPHQLCKQAGLSDYAIKVNHMSRSTFLKLDKAFIQLEERSVNND